MPPLKEDASDDEAGEVAESATEGKHDEMSAFKVDQNGTRREIIQRDDVILTPQQVQQNWLEIESAMLKELQTWARLKCFSRRPAKERRTSLTHVGSSSKDAAIHYHSC